MNLRYHLVNVFTRNAEALSGNPLCVFEDGSELSGQKMQAIARQFNLSETTFLTPSKNATAHVRIFTPSEELPFAGHPTLGTAHIVRMRTGKTEVSLEMKAGVIPVSSENDVWTLTANAPTHRDVSATGDQLAAALGLKSSDIGERPLWVNTGTEQLLVPLQSAEAVRRAAPVPALLRWVQSSQGRSHGSVFHENADRTVITRFFFRIGDGYAEDPATGSACANLGGWCIAMGRTPTRLTLYQGDQIGRPSTLHLAVDEERTIRVSGAVAYLGTGEISI
jgi:PhzF family phenazine biosynthesis protein